MKSSTGTMGYILAQNTQLIAGDKAYISIRFQPTAALTAT